MTTTIFSTFLRNKNKKCSFDKMKKKVQTDQVDMDIKQRPKCQLGNKVPRKCQES